MTQTLLSALGCNVGMASGTNPTPITSDLLCSASSRTAEQRLGFGVVTRKIRLVSLSLNRLPTSCVSQFPFDQSCRIK